MAGCLLIQASALQPCLQAQPVLPPGLKDYEIAGSVGLALGFFQATTDTHLLSDEPDRAPSLSPLSGELQGGVGPARLLPGDKWLGPEAWIQYPPGFPKNRKHSFPTWSHSAETGACEIQLGQVGIKARIHSLRVWPTLSHLLLCPRMSTLPLRPRSDAPPQGASSHPASSSPLSPLHLGRADCSTSTFSSPHPAARFFSAGATLYIGLEPSGKRSPRWAVSGAVGEAPSEAGRASGREAVLWICSTSAGARHLPILSHMLLTTAL